MIGSHIVPLLRGEGHRITVLDDLSAGRREHVPEDVRLIVGSILDDTALAAAISDKPDYVLHLATVFANQNSIDHPESDLAVNGLGTLRILKCCAEAGVKKVLFTSSSCVYGDKYPMREADADFQPTTPYAATKLLGEQYARIFVECSGLDIVIVRLFNVFGPNEYPEIYRNVIPKFFASALQNKPLSISGTGYETRDFTFVLDAVDGIRRALFAATRPGDVFNVASGRETSICELAKNINDIMGNDAGVTHGPRRDWDRVLRRRGNIEKARKLLGYAPRFDLQEGLKRTANWFLSTFKDDVILSKIDLSSNSPNARVEPCSLQR
jgi:UDP-glucose 4-epimerase